MATDIATLAIRIQSLEAKVATMELDKLSRASDKAERSTSGLGSEARNTDQAFGSMGKSVGSALLKFGGLTAIVATMYKLSEASIKAAAAFETQRTEFGIFMQDMDMGASMFADIQTFAASTPLAVEQLSEVTKQLLSFGSEADEVLDQVRMLGDAALGNGQKLETLARSFGRVQARGRASMEEINMAMEAGLPIIDELGKAMGVTQAEVFDLVSSGKVGFEEFRLAFENMTSEGGKFNDGMELLSQTFNGKLSTAMDNVKLLGAEIFEPAMEGAKGFLDWLSDTTKGLREFIAETKRINREEVEYAESSVGQLEDQMRRVAEIRSKYLEEKAWIDDYGVTSKSSLANLQRLKDQLDTELEILNAIEQQMMAEQRLAEAKEDAERWAREKAAADKADAEEAEKRLKREKEINELYKELRNTVVDTLEAERSELDKLRETYDLLAAHPWSSGQLEEDRVQALDVLLKKILELRDAEWDWAEEAEKAWSKADERFFANVDAQSIFDEMADAGGEWQDKLNSIRTEYESGEITTREYLARLEELKEKYGEATAKEKLFEEAIHNLNVRLIEGAVTEFADAIYDIGTAFGDGSISAETFGEAVGNVGRQLMRMIPTMAVAAGLQLLFANPNDPRGWWLVGGGITGMLGAGFIEGAITENAHGNVYENGSVTPFAKGAVVTKPTIFPMASGAGLMGEAGPEAIMPLARTASGDLGVRAAGGNTYVTVINNSENSAVRTEENTRANGEKEIMVFVENIVDQGIARGRFDKSNAKRYGSVPKGVRV